MPDLHVRRLGPICVLSVFSLLLLLLLLLLCDRAKADRDHRSSGHPLREPRPGDEVPLGHAGSRLEVQHYGGGEAAVEVAPGHDVLCAYAVPGIYGAQHREVEPFLPPHRSGIPRRGGIEPTEDAATLIPKLHAISTRLRRAPSEREE